MVFGHSQLRPKKSIESESESGRQKTSQASHHVEARLPFVRHDKLIHMVYRQVLTKVKQAEHIAVNFFHFGFNSLAVGVCAFVIMITYELLLI